MKNDSNECKLLISPDYDHHNVQDSFEQPQEVNCLAVALPRTLITSVVVAHILCLCRETSVMHNNLTCSVIFK
jgi:hypothetical protein